MPSQVFDTFHYISKDIFKNLGGHATLFSPLISIYTHTIAWDQKRKLMRIPKIEFSELWSANSYHMRMYDKLRHDLN